jgi:GNAT superfamily N-acetyltransferase
MSLVLQSELFANSAQSTSEYRKRKDVLWAVLSTPPGIIQGHEALVANVYTEPDWRRRGVAALLMRHVLAYTREHRIERVLLHASDDGRPLYESLGFVPTSEMKLTTST